MGQFGVEPAPGVVELDGGVVVDGDAPVDGVGLVSGVTVGEGEVAAWATTKVPKPPATPMPTAIAALAIGPRAHPRTFID